MRRVLSGELLDDDRGTPAEVEQSLDDLWRINRWLGGISGSIHLLEHFFVRTGPHPVRILDVGSGDARMAGRVQSELLRRGLQAKVFVLDRRLTHLECRHSTRGLAPVVADVLNLPFRPASFEVVTCNLFLHHFSGESALELLRALGTVASEAVLINDLERHLLPYLFIRCALPFARSRITRYDGPASVRQAYTRKELAELAAAAGYRDFEVERLPLFRLGLCLWKKPARRKG
jgi:2-polyprenyl-3-methyl-5-hydroxy-6-metoxy-1,4-benzoquinol methylase